MADVVSVLPTHADGISPLVTDWLGYGTRTHPTPILAHAEVGAARWPPKEKLMVETVDYSVRTSNTSGHTTHETTHEFASEPSKQQPPAGGSAVEQWERSQAR